MNLLDDGEIINFNMINNISITTQTEELDNNKFLELLKLTLLKNKNKHNEKFIEELIQDKDFDTKYINIITGLSGYMFLLLFSYSLYLVI